MSKAYLDPGRAKPSAIAVIENDQRLVELAWLSGENYTTHAGYFHTPITSLLWEKPQVYPRSKVNPNQIVDDAINGALAANFLRRCIPGLEVREIAPRAWKGTLDKPSHHMRLWVILTPEEKAMLGGDETYAYIFAAAERLAMTGKVSGYSKPIVDLLDAVAMGKYDCGLLAGPLMGKVQINRGRFKRK